MHNLLVGISGIAWTIVYVESIRLGFNRQTYAMPAAALALNIAWEWLHTAHRFATGNVDLQTWVMLAWAFADVGVLATYVLYGRKELPSFVGRGGFLAWTGALVGMSFLVQWLFAVEFGYVHDRAPAYSAFLQNLLMSGLFIAMFISRKGSRGQSLVIAVAKWLGTLAPTIQWGWTDGEWPFIAGIGLLCSVFDLSYVGLLVWAKRKGL